MNEILVIGLNVFRQLMRNRILVVLFAFAAALAATVYFVSSLGVEVETRLARDIGLLAIE